MALVRHGIKQIHVSRLKLPGDIPDRRRKPHVVQLGQSFASTGGAPLETPVVERGTYRLLCGRDRIAACMNEDIKLVDCLVVSGEADEMDEIVEIENAMRRHSAGEQAAAVAKLVEIHAARAQRAAGPFPEVADPPAAGNDNHDDDLDAPAAPATPAPRRKHPNRVRSEAIREVAAKTGRTPGAVKKAVARKNAREREETPPTEKPEPLFATFGRPVADAVVAKANAQHQALSGMRAKLVLLEGELTRIEREAGEQFPRLREALHTAAYEAKQAEPSSVCPWCKQLEGYQEHCNACGGEGFVRVSQMQNVDRRLLAVGSDAGIFVDGEWLPLADLESRV